MNEGPSWRELRRFTISSLRDFGMGNRSLQYKIHEEITTLTGVLKDGPPCSKEFPYILSTTVSNIICSTVLGQRYEYDDPDFRYMLQLLDKGFKSGKKLSLVEALPILRFLPGDYFQVIQYRHLIPAPVDRTPASAWL